MTTKIAATLVVASALCASLILAQPKAGGPPPGKGGKGGAQPAAPKQVTITAIPSVIKAGVQWKQAWEGPATADGMSGGPDGGLYFAQEQTNMIGHLDKDDHFKIFTYAHGPGAVSIGADGRMYAVERTCTDPGIPAGTCMIATDIAVLTPERKILADKQVSGAALGRVNDLTVSKTGHAYVTSGGVLHMKPSGEVEAIGQGLNTNGIIMSPDEKILYVTNGAAIAAFDVAADGSLSNQREFGRLEGGGGGDGMAVDSEGRLYVTGGVGVHVLGKDGKYLGAIPTPRAPITLAFSGPDKKTLYVGTMGVTMGDGKEYLTTDGRRNTAMTVYKVQMESQGFKGRAR